MRRILAVGVAAILAVLLMAGCGGMKKDYVILDEKMANEEYVIGFKKGNQSLCNEIYKAMVELNKEGALEAISKEWFGENKLTLPDEYTAPEATDDSFEKVKQKGVLTMGMDDAFPPMGFRGANGWDIVGFDVDVARKVCEKLGIGLDLVAINWNAKENELNGGKVDCLWNGFSSSPEREEAMTLTPPYMNNTQVVVVLKGSPIKALSDLEGKTVVLQKGSTAEGALNSKAELRDKLKGGGPILVDNNVLALNDLSKGGSDAVVMDEVVARYYINHGDKLAEDAAAAASNATKE